jgi:galactonate dehydratase
MRITGVETFLMSAGAPVSATGGAENSSATVATATGLPFGTTRHWLFVEVHTDQGITGVGEGSGWPLVVEAAVRDLAPLIVGEDPTDIERLWLKLRLAMASHGITGTVGGGALTAIEMALWDIKGKVLGTPVWNLLGGRVRDRIRVYAHASTPAHAKACVELGYRALKTGGVANPIEKVAALREAVGPDVDLMVDLHGPPDLTTKDAMVVGRELERFRLLFWEEPVSADNWEGLARLRDTVAIPLASGERLATIWEFQRLLAGGCIDVVQPDTGRIGGISQMRKLAAMAEAAFVTMAPHSGSLGPVAEYAALHVLASIPNALILERFSHDWPGREAVVTPPVEVIDGHIAVPDRPGLGIELVKPEIWKHPPGRNAGIRASEGSGTFEPGTTQEHVQVQTRWRRASYFGATK